MATKKTVEAVIEPVAEMYTAEAIVASDLYRRYRDLLTVLLEAERTYSLDEVDKILKQALRQPVER